MTEQTDPISQDQAALDGAGEPPEPQYVTTEQFGNLMAQMQQQSATIETMNRQQAGLQGKIDTGLNAIRRDTTAIAEQRIQEAEAQNRNVFLSGIEDPSLQAQMRSYLENQDALAQQRVDLTRQPEPEQAAVAQGAPQQADQMAQLREWVRSIAEMDPNTPGIDYATALRSDLDVNARHKAFMQSVIAAGKPSIPASNQAPPPSPPVERPAAGVGGYRNASDLRSAYVEDKLTREQYVERMKAIGETP